MAQKVLCPLDPAPDDESIGRTAKRLPERPAKVRNAQTGKLGQLQQRQVRREVIINSLNHPVKVHRGEPAFADSGRISLPAHQLGEDCGCIALHKHGAERIAVTDLCTYPARCVEDDGILEAEIR